MSLERLPIPPALIEAGRRCHLGVAAGDDRLRLGEFGWQRLQGGNNNGVYKIEVATGKYCCKFYKVDGRQRDKREWAALEFLAAQGFEHILPRPLFYQDNVQSPLIILGFIEGEHLGYSCLQQGQWTRLAAHMRALQAIPYREDVAALDRLDGRARLEGMQGFFAVAAAADQPRADCIDLWRGWVESPAGAVLRRPNPLVFSRMDTSLANCLWDGEQLRFIDLEYSGWTERAFDLAEQVEHDQSRGTPDETWQAFIKDFDLSEEEYKAYWAARQLMGFFWLSKFWPKGDGAPSAKFIRQVERVRRLCATTPQRA